MMLPYQAEPGGPRSAFRRREVNRMAGPGGGVYLRQILGSDQDYTPAETLLARTLSPEALSRPRLARPRGARVHWTGGDLGGRRGRDDGRHARAPRPGATRERDDSPERPA